MKKERKDMDYCRRAGIKQGSENFEWQAEVVAAWHFIWSFVSFRCFWLLDIELAASNMTQKQNVKAMRGSSKWKKKNTNVTIIDQNNDLFFFDHSKFIKQGQSMIVIQKCWQAS